MLKLFKNILLFTAVVAILFSTSGFSVYHHHCSCSDMAETSMLIKNFDCSHYNNPENQCSTDSEEQASCCQHTKTTPEPEKDTSEDDCCTTTHDFVKITIDLKIDNYKPTIQLYSTQLSCTRIIENNEKAEDFTEFNTMEAPPPKPAKSILISHHQLKLDPSVA